MTKSCVISSRTRTNELNDLKQNQFQEIRVERTKSLRSGWAQLKSQLCHLLAIKFWTSYFMSSSLFPHLWNGIMKLPWEVPMRIQWGNCTRLAYSRYLKSFVTFFLPLFLCTNFPWKQKTISIIHFFWSYIAYVFIQ